MGGAGNQMIHLQSPGPELELANRRISLPIGVLKDCFTSYTIEHGVIATDNFTATWYDEHNAEDSRVYSYLFKPHKNFTGPLYLTVEALPS